MAKGKTKTGVPNKHLHARISYLQQAATYLALQAQRSDPQNHGDSLPAVRTEATATPNQPQRETTRRTVEPAGSSEPKPATSELVVNCSGGTPTDTEASVDLAFRTPPSGGLSTHFVSHLRQVAQKSTIRLHPNIKHTICRTCSAVFIEGHSCKKYMENLSRGGRKPHADVLVFECVACGTKKRFPVGASKQTRKALRKQVINRQDDPPLADGHRTAQGGPDG